MYVIELAAPEREGNEVRFRWREENPSGFYRRRDFTMRFPVDLGKVGMAVWNTVMLLCLHPHWNFLRPCRIILPFRFRAGEKLFWERLIEANYWTLESLREPGHSTGRYAGSTWFADHFAIDLYENCIAQINCDSPGCRWATEYRHISWMDEAEPFAQEVIRDVTGQDSWGERPHQAGDYSFNNIGISSFFMLLSTMPDEERERLGYYGVGGCGANIEWHTEEDLIHIADKDILMKDMKIYLAATMGAANAIIAPFDFAKTLRGFEETLAKYQEAAGPHFDFANARLAIDELSAALRDFADFTRDIAITDAGSEPVKRANAAIRPTFCSPRRNSSRSSWLPPTRRTCSARCGGSCLTNCMRSSPPSAAICCRWGSPACSGWRQR